jgi:hypothetical protein
MSMYCMARDNDMEGISRLLDEGVNPAVDEERSGVRLTMGRCIAGKVEVSLYSLCLMRC